MPGSSYTRLVSSSSATTPAGASPSGVVGDAIPLPVKLYGPPAFRVLYADIAPAANKYMALLFNASTTVDVLVHAIHVLHTNISAATGVLLKQTLLRVSAFTTGTAKTPIAFDARNDTLPSGISADTNSSSVTDVSGGLLHPGFFCTGEEVILTAASLLLERLSLNRTAIFLSDAPGCKPIVLSGNTANNKGIAVKNLTSDTEGTLSYIIDFTTVNV